MVLTSTELTPAGVRLRDAASELFYDRGITAVGVDLIAERAGTTKKTLYDRFGSKEGLVVAYLQHRFERWQRFVEEHLDASPATGVDRVVEPLRALGVWMEQNRRGCGFANAYAELAGTGHAGLELISAEKRWIAERYAALAAEAGLPEPERLGVRMAILQAGAISTATAGGVAEAVEEAIAMARALLDSTRG